ncbi:hypothetical protein [Candidatus Stoquefichus sp. SB1]|uniref:hypothetical protein n=1 Tax=Candidatus Stoquefichus sp. SB1 TaxID=1658109 RepID=UPI00067E786E|nr:hypothetical protein [Candidatus Stoquefichus sp. SB1]
MKKKIIIILGLVISLILILAGYYIKQNSPQEYYLNTEQSYSDTIAQINHIENKEEITIHQSITVRKYIGVLAQYKDQIYFYLFKSTLGNYYEILYTKTMGVKDKNIYYKVISNQDDYTVFAFGYNFEDEIIEFYPLGAYETTTYNTEFYPYSYGISVLDVGGSAPEEIRINNQSHEFIGQAKRCE